MFGAFYHLCALRRGSISSSTASSGGPQQPQPPKEDAATEEEMRNLSPDPEDAAAAASNPAPDSEAPALVEPAVAAVRKTKTLRLQIRENSWFGKKCLKIFKLFTNTFAMTFLAEWGDR
jgi:putative Ca2+/H+ antiporter (TMEM165/GDT1 family)